MEKGELPQREARGVGLTVKLVLTECDKYETERLNQNILGHLNTSVGQKRTMINFIKKETKFEERHPSIKYSYP